LLLLRTQANPPFNQGMLPAPTVSAPCLTVRAEPKLDSSRRDLEDTVQAGTDSDASSAPSVDNEVSAAKPVPKANFIAPKFWMVALGVVLAVCAGAVDVVASRSLDVFVSHVTGTVAKVGMRLEGLTTGTSETWDVFHSVLLVAAFVFGSFLCGLVIPKNQVHFGGKSFYGVALLANSCLLVAAGFLAPPVLESATEARAVAAGCLAAMACGLQNAMCTMHFGAVVRTTHVTGTATDIGSTAGRAAMILLRSGCRRRKANDFERMELWDDAMKLFVLLPIFAGFLLGTILGAFLHSKMGAHALFAPAMITGITGLLYTFLRTQLKRQIKKFEERRLQDELLEMESALQKAHSYLETASHGGTHRDDLDDLDDIIGQSLRVMHDVEASIAELCGKPSAGAARLDRSRTL